jgi:hypothetical protein
MLYVTNGPRRRAGSRRARVWLIDRLRRERPVRETHGKHTLWEALAHPRDQAPTKGPPSAGGDQRGARPATTACGAPPDRLGSQLTHWWRELDSNHRFLMEADLRAHLHRYGVDLRRAGTSSSQLTHRSREMDSNLRFLIGSVLWQNPIKVPRLVAGQWREPTGAAASDIGAEASDQTIATRLRPLEL